MLIQLIIFLTKTKIFASEINSSGKAESISIKGNTEIKCEDKENIDELIECLYDAYNIDDFADENFDIIILEAGADREIINCLQGKCKGAAKLNTISVEKLLPVIVSNKNMVKPDEEFSVTFADMFYKIACDENGIIKVGKARKSEGAVELKGNDLAFLYYFVANSAMASANERKLEEAKEKIVALQYKLNHYETELEELREMQKQFVELQERQNRKEEEKEHNSQSTDVNQICPNCGENLKPGSNYCENCGMLIFNNNKQINVVDNVEHKANLSNTSSGATQMLEIVQNYKKRLDNLDNTKHTNRAKRVMGGFLSFAATLAPDENWDFNDRNSASEAWDFSIKNSISRNKLNGTINHLNSLIEKKIDINKFLGLFEVYDKSYSLREDTKIILFTEEGIFFDEASNLIDNCWQLPEPGFLPWSDIKLFKARGSEIEMVLFGQDLTMFDFGGVVSDDVINEIVAMGNKLKDVDI